MFRHQMLLPPPCSVCHTFSASTGCVLPTREQPWKLVGCSSTGRPVAAAMQLTLAIMLDGATFVPGMPDHLLQHPLLDRRSADKLMISEAQHQSLSSDVLNNAGFVMLQGQLDAEQEAVEDAVQRRREADAAARGLQEETVHLQVQQFAQARFCIEQETIGL